MEIFEIFLWKKNVFSRYSTSSYKTIDQKDWRSGHSRRNTIINRNLFLFLFFFLIFLIGSKLSICQCSSTSVIHGKLYTNIDIYFWKEIATMATDIWIWIAKIIRNWTNVWQNLKKAANSNEMLSWLKVFAKITELIF